MICNFCSTNSFESKTCNLPQVLLKKNPAYAMEAFEYKQEEDLYVCLAKEVLTTNGKEYHKKLLNGRQSYKVKHYKTKACKKCQLRSACTSNKLGKVI